MNSIITTSIIVSVVTGLSEVGKMVGFKKKYLPLLNLVLSTALGGLFLKYDLKLNLFVGLICGLIACGVFDQTKMFKKEE